MRLEAITIGAETQLAIKKKIVLTDDLLLIACSPPCSAHFAILWYKNSLISLQMKQLEAFNRPILYNICKPTNGCPSMTLVLFLLKGI